MTQIELTPLQQEILQAHWDEHQRALSWAAATRRSINDILMVLGGPGTVAGVGEDGEIIVRRPDEEDGEDE